MPKWTQNLEDLLSLFLESNCPLCQRPTSQEFCQDCINQLQHCCLPHSTWNWEGRLPVFGWGTYGGTLKQAITALKYQNRPQLARPLGQWLASAWLNSQLASAALVVIPIPLHTNRHKQRGYNQAALLAQSFCNLTRLPLQHKGLERIRETEAQFGLSVSEREKNLAMAFKLGSGFRDHYPKRQVLLLDDIFTTGATAYSAAQTLSNSGIPVYGLVTLATTQRKH